MRVSAVASAVVVAGLFAASASAAPAAPRLVYASDWTGQSRVYAVDSARPRAVAELAGPSAKCASSSCGASRPTTSPDGLWLTFFGGPDPRTPSLYVARSDGSARRLVARFATSVVWSRNSRRFAYSMNDAWFAYDLARRRWQPLPQLFGATSVSWVGGTLAYASSTSSTELGLGRRRCALPFATREVAWSPDGRRVAYVNDDGLHVARSNCTARRPLASGAWAGPSWSSDGRFVAAAGTGERVGVFDVVRGTSRELGGRLPLRWSPRRPTLAAAGSGGLTLNNVSTGVSRRVEVVPTQLAWSPRGDSIAYVTGQDLGVVSLGGRVRTLIEASGRYGGAIRTVAWSEPRAPRYRAPVPRTVARTSPDGLEAPWLVTELAVDGGRVLYVACNHLFVWTPATGEVVQTEAVASLSCPVNESYDIFDVGLARDHLAFGTAVGCTGGQWTLVVVPLARLGAAATVGWGRGSRCGVSFDVAMGEIVGSGDVLAYSTWQGSFVFQTMERRTTSQTIHRVGHGAIAQRAGALVPLDAGGERIAVSRGDTFAILDGTGTEQWSRAVDADAAFIADDEVVVVDGAVVVVLDLATGAIAGTGRLPDGRVGRDCDTPFNFWCGLPPEPVSLQDAGAGWLVYTFDGRVRAHRITDGTEVDLGPGKLARFTDTGLVIVDGTRIRLIRFAALPVG